MNLRKLLLVGLSASVILFWGCSHNHSDHDHEGHEHSEHEEHADHDHEGHDHDGHDHDHEHEGEEHGEKDAEHMPHEEDVAFSPARAKAIGLTTEKAAPGLFSEVIKTSGRVMSAGGEEQVVFAPASGKVHFSNPSLTAGSSVSAGQSLFSVSSKGMADGDVLAADKTALENARKAYNRIKSLYDRKLATIDELQEAEAAVNAANAALNGYGNRAAGGAVGVSSPIGGYIVSLDVNPGQYVSAGQQLATVASQRRLKVQANLSERYFRNAASITGANIIVPADPDNTIRLADLNGKVTGRGRASDNGHSMPVFLEFDNPGTMINGSFVEVYLLAAPRDNVISVPKDALVEEQGLFYVFVKEGENQYHKTAVKKGLSDGSRVEITEGLRGGEKVVTKGARELKLASNAGAVPGHTHNH